jgi:hypothetical protein
MIYASSSIPTNGRTAATEGYTCHEVGALRAGGSSGRTNISTERSSQYEPNEKKPALGQIAPKAGS